MTTILNGLLGGLLAGLVAAIVTGFVDSEPSATATLLNGVLGSRASSRLVELVARLSYGCLAGGVLLALELFVLGVLGVPPTTGEALGVAVAWSALLFGSLVAIGRVASPLSFDWSRLREPLVYHLVYGIGLGLWIRMTWIT